MKNLKTILTLIALAAGFGWTSVALAQASTAPQATEPAIDAGNLRAFVELARSDIKNDKALIIAENLPMTEAEAAEFWPLHRDYEAELSKLNDQKLALIVRYAHNYQTMTDMEATELAQSTFNLEAKKTDLKRKYFKKFLKVIPATKAARFFQIENQLNMALDLQVAAAMPLIK
jgi:hypothetical protein